MANIFTGATADAGTGQLSNQVLTAYDRVAFFALRNQVVWDQFAKVKPGNLTSPGNPVSFLFWNDLTPATTPLSETVDVDAVGLSDSSVTVTPQEHGNAIIKTIRIRTDDYLIGFDSDVASLLAWNLVDTIDALALAAVNGGTNEDYVGQVSEAAITATDIMTADEMRQKNAELRNAAAMPWEGLFYVSIMNPDVSYDLKSETGDGAWVAPHQYVDTKEIYTNEVGTFAGFRVVETPRTTINADGGAGTVDTYSTYFFGREFLAKAESIAPHMVMGPVTDKLMRFQPLGWHFYSGWDTLREASLRRLLSASSIGAN
jgi:N4-gp56 family major capsid protein